MQDSAHVFEDGSVDELPDVDRNLSHRYLALVADVAGRLLAADAPDTMVDELFELIRTELRLDVFFNYRLEGDGLVLEACGGLTQEQAEACARLEIGQAVCGCVARDRKPIHATSVQCSDDPMTAFVRSFGVDAYACTPLLHGNELIGTLSFGRRWTDRFTDDELSFLHTICHYVGVAKHRRRTEAQLHAAVALRDRLLSELNHRVRNALQMAISLLQIDAGEASEPAAQTSLARAAERIQVLATAHRPLYAEGDSRGLDVPTLLKQIAEQVTAQPALVTATDCVTVPVEHAVALGLLVHEIVSTRYAGTAITIDLARTMKGDSATTLLIRFESPVASNEELPSRETRMMKALSRQLRASLIVSGSGGLRLEMPDPGHD